MRSLLWIAVLLALSGCGSLPHDGPSASAVAKGASKDSFALVDLDYRVAQVVAANPARPLDSLAAASNDAPVNLIGEGDRLAVSIIEPGSAASPENGLAPSSRSFPDVIVGDGGRISVPFAGSLVVAGLTPAGAAERIRSALRGKIINPQVTVSVTSNVANAVTVIGEVRVAGRYPLSANNDRLLDVIASAGGPTKPAPDLVVNIVRGQTTAVAAFATLLEDPSQDVRLAPRDQIRVLYRPRRFSTFGAFAKASQIAIEDDSLTLAGAISRMGGLDANSANAQSVLVFRFERPQVVRALGLPASDDPRGTPVIYRLNLRDPAGYFVANRFFISADDLIYVPRSNLTEAKMFFELVNSITQVAYNVTVSRVLK